MRKWVVPLVIYATAYLDVDGSWSSKDAVVIEACNAVRLESVNGDVEVELGEVDYCEPTVSTEVKL